MFVSLIFLTLFYLPCSNEQKLPIHSDSDVYHTLFGNIGSMEDLFLKESNEPTPQPTRRDSTADDNDTSTDELDLELPDIFEFKRTNLNNHSFDLIDFLIINEKYQNFTKEYKNEKKTNNTKSRMNEQMNNTLNNNTRRHWLDDPDDYYHGESIEELKKNQLTMVLAQFALHCRYEVGKALAQRDLVRNDKRYKLGYLFNRMRRLKSEQLKQAGASWRQNWDWKGAEVHAIMRSYERVVHFDVDMRDTANLIKTIYNKDEPYDFFVIKGKNQN